MTKEEMSVKRDLMRERKATAIRKVAKVGRVLSGAGISYWVVTGSQALIIHGFMIHRDGDDVDVRISVPSEKENNPNTERKRILSVLKSWSLLFPKENEAARKKYGNKDTFFTIVVEDIKVNIFVLDEEEIIDIPFSTCGTYMVEDVASVLMEKLACGRSKDYRDMNDCWNAFTGE